MKRIIVLFLYLFIVTCVFGADTQKVYNKAVASVVSLKVDNPKGGGIGTGFFALEPGIIVTCYHVVEGATRITAKNSKGNTVPVEGIIDYSVEKDIALLKASSKNSNLLELQANMPTPGTSAYVLGSPKGLDFSFSTGVVSQIRRGKETLIQFTCPVSPGNSGGPLLSDDGKVMGIVVAQLTEGQNLNFAVPSAMIYMLNKDNAVTRISNANNIGKENGAVTTDAIIEKAVEIIKHNELGDKYFKGQLYEAAAEEYLLSLRILPEQLNVLDKLCGCYSLLNQYDKLKLVAEAGARLSIQKDDHEYLGNFYAHLADVYFYYEKEYNKAINYYNLILDNKLRCVYDEDLIYSRIAFCYGELKDYRNSIKYLKKAFELNPHEENCYNIGVLYLKLKDYKLALPYFEKAIKINPDYEPAKETLKRCKAILKR